MFVRFLAWYPAHNSCSTNQWGLSFRVASRQVKMEISNSLLGLIPPRFVRFSVLCTEEFLFVSKLWGWGGGVVGDGNFVHLQEEFARASGTMRLSSWLRHWVILWLAFQSFPFPLDLKPVSKLPPRQDWKKKKTLKLNWEKEVSIHFFSVQLMSHL